MLKKLLSKLNIRSISVILLTILFTVLPFYNILIKGVYRWHITQPEFWQGGIEILVFIFVAFAISAKCEDKMDKIILVFGAIYLSMNGVIIPFITVYIYFEILHYIGFTVLNLKKDECSNNIIENFISGISVWGMFAIICSLLRHGTFNDLRILTVVLLIICMVLNRKKKCITLFCHFNKFINKHKLNNLSKISIIILTFLVLALVAKTNTTQDYDSLWYGLRPEHVLIGDHSFYDYLGYSAFVYYYPKLMELLFLPISNLGDYSFIIIGNVFIYILLIVSLYRILNNIVNDIDKDDSYKFNLVTWIILVVVTIPAITGITDTAKPDILGCFLTVCAFMFFREFLNNHKKVYLLIFTLISLLLSTGTKLTYILWGGILLLLVISTIVVTILNKKTRLYDFNFIKLKYEYFIFMSSIFFTFGVHYRTLKLTGYPIYPVFTNVFVKLGFKGIYPAFNLRNSSDIVENWDFKYILNRLYEVFFNPNNSPHIIMLWISSVLPFVFILFLLLAKKGTFSKNKSVFIFVILYCIAFLYYIIFMKIPDGNYFIAPIIILITIVINKIFTKSKLIFNNINIKITIFIIVMFICLQTPIMFVSSPSWQIGTKPFSKEIIRNNYGTNYVNENSYKTNGYVNIAKYISENMKRKRIISSYMDLTIINRIDGDIETYEQIKSPTLSNSDITESYESFSKYITYAKIKGFLLLKDDNSEFKKYIDRYIKENGYAKILDDEKAVFYVINDTCDYISPIRIDSEDVWDDGWLPQESNFKISTKEKGKINIEGYYPFNINDDLTGIVYVNDVPNEFKIEKQNFNIEISAQKNSTVSLKIKCDFYNQNNDKDLRKLSFVLSNLESS